MFVFLCKCGIEVLMTLASVPSLKCQQGEHAELSLELQLQDTEIIWVGKAFISMRVLYSLAFSKYVYDIVSDAPCEI